MLNHVLSVLVVVFVICFSVPLGVQAQVDCSPAALQALFAESMTEYGNQIGESATEGDALEVIEEAQATLNRMLDTCKNLAPTTAGTERGIGTGTLADPFAFGIPGDTGEGFTIAITGLINPADNIIRNENMFNDRPQTGQVYIILDVTVECLEGSGRCEVNYFDFELVGDRGVVYEDSFIVLENALDVSLFAGAEGTGRLAFLIDAEDSNLKLLYRPNMFRDEIVVFSAEPDASSGLEITASSSINIRSAPSTNAGVVGTLPTNASAIAFGRNEEGTWLQISTGWVFAELVTFNGDITRLPVTAS